MALTEYRKKRNFRVTREPRGGRLTRHKTLSFVIQKHAASHLHYDFRLELGGVLKSWAIPKGPSADPAVKRLAMHVEDHPLEYGQFEGIIPQGEYGGGTVLLWDRGTWEPVEDGKKAYREGSLKFTLRGEKLKGRWMLVRKGGKRDPDEKHWFLFKEKDEFADPDSDVTVDQPLSVTTGRDLDEIAGDADRIWGPEGEARRRERAGTKVPNTTLPSRRSVRHRTVGESDKNDQISNGKPATLRKSGVKKLGARERTSLNNALKRVGVKKKTLPPTPSVQLATLVSEAPDGDDWLHEIKFDGYRMLCRVDKGKARFISRNGKDWTAKFRNLTGELAALPVKSAIIDGEVVILDEAGRTSFQLLQNAFKSAGPSSFLFYAFDLLFLNGYDVSDASIEERKSLLQKMVPNGDGSAVKYSDHVTGKGRAFFAEAARLQLEGIISKRAGRPYIGGRGHDWLKVKCSLREEFVIGGFTKPTGSRKHFGALLLGYYDRDHKLIYAGRVGTGFDDRTLTSLRRQFTELIEQKSSFSNLSGTTGQAQGVTWLKPTLVAQVEFSNWTDERQLRHPSFQGLREDKAATNVVRDNPISPKSIQSTTKASGTSPRSAKLGPKSRGPKSKRRSSGDGEVAGVSLTHPAKVLYSDAGITKLDLAQYYEQVAPWMLPHVENRLLSLVRCPAGSGHKCFFQKHPSESTSDFLVRTDVEEKKKTEEYLSVTDVSGLIALVQMGVLEIHVWGSKADQYEKPDRLVFDLDPDPSVDWPDVVVAAKEVRILLEELDLISFVKTTGGKGLHIVVPVQRRTSWDDAKTFCHAVANFMVAAAPDRYIAKMSKAARKHKIFVDYLRNDRGATAVAPYSTRNKPGATVSVPIRWEELTNDLTSDYFNVLNLPPRLAKLRKDPWTGIETTEQSLTAAMLKKLKLR